MNNFISTLLATTIAFAGVTVGKQTYDNYHASKALVAAAAIAEEVEEVVKEEAERELSENIAALVKSREELDSWQIIDNTNPVTRNRVITVSKLSEDYDGALVFRCYDNREGNSRRYDYFFVFPESLFGHKEDDGWVMYKLDDAKPVASSIKKAINNYSANFFVIHDEAEAKKYPSLYGGELARLKKYRREFYETLDDQPAQYFNNVLDAKTLTIVAEHQGNISEQMMAFNVTGIREAIKPIIEYCERDSLM